MLIRGRSSASAWAIGGALDAAIATEKELRERLGYSLRHVAWLPGGRYTYPADAAKIEYFYDRGFPDIFEEPINLPYPSFL